MNEKRDSFYKYQKGKSEMELDQENLIAMIASLEARSHKIGAYPLMRLLMQLKKAVVQNNGNKKTLKAATAKYNKYKEQLNMLENSGGRRK